MDERLINQVADRVLKTLRDMQAIGESRARPQAEVARAAMTSSRALQRATLALNQRGIAVVSTCQIPAGVYIAETDAELAQYDAQLDHRIRGVAIRLREIRRIRRARTAAEMIEPDGQRRMFG